MLLEIHKLVEAAHMDFVDEDLRHRRDAAGAFHHLAAQARFEHHVVLGETDALLGQQSLGRMTVAAQHGGVYLDLGQNASA